MMKYDWKKQARNLYLPKNQPEIVNVPAMNFFMLSGEGNPNNSDFAEAVGVLYSLSYGVKMLPKHGAIPPGYFEYSVFPLEGIWDLADDAKGLPQLDKDRLQYTVMIRQPDFVTAELAQTVIDTTTIKKPNPLLERVKFENYTEGRCLQMMHNGPYDNEPESFPQMAEYCEAHQLQRLTKTHREIYISDVRKTPPEKRKTVLRFQVKAAC